MDKMRQLELANDLNMRVLTAQHNNSRHWSKLYNRLYGLYYFITDNANKDLTDKEICEIILDSHSPYASFGIYRKVASIYPNFIDDLRLHGPRMVEDEVRRCISTEEETIQDIKRELN